LCDAAGPYEVLIPTMQLGRLPNGIHASPHKALELRGFPGLIEVFELSGELDPDDRRDSSELWTRAPFGL
jgi:hypothetical protein